MGTGWVWKRVSEKGPAKKQYHVSQKGSPEECLISVWESPSVESGAGKEQIDLQGSRKEWFD